MRCLRGHDDMMRFDKGGIYLECQTCGRKTPGWMTTRPAPITITPKPPVTRRMLAVLGIAFQLIVASKIVIESKGPRLTPAEAVAIVLADASDRNLTGVGAFDLDAEPRVAVAPCWDCAIIDARNAFALWRSPAPFANVRRHGFYAQPFGWSIGPSTHRVGPSNRVQTRQGR